MSGGATWAGEREAAVQRRLDLVFDPELDEPVTELGFVTRIVIEGDGSVSIGFRLPTYWCAANFAFMMAEDMRREVGALPWVSRVEVTLGEHMYADTINAGLSAGLGFREAFGAAACGDLDDLRRTFLVKAFQRREEALLRHLAGHGLDAEALAALSLEALEALPLDADGERLRRRYLERRGVVAGPAGRSEAFLDEAGAPLSAQRMPEYLRMLGRVGINTAFNGALCRSLLAARFDEEPPPGQEPDLGHFVRRAAREAAAGGMAGV